MSQRERVSIMSIGVVIGLVLGVIFKNMYQCLVTGILVSSAITVMLSRQAKKANGK
ncbi:hypothetical protein Desru_2776 [Desulforamulus ruminis DSM 2154]|uniref:Uncharacterized protein n=1 Tax=Desulforamulus ruminis (strain ATCC 23193 / DSM 2154 / NCIMB 8452 / DL) TaxID=696281 RepID=F6DRX0_DESRL|nr:hypothetical protein Desru_2776 [Desulforamulus ruminis DSM 2154]